MRPNLGLIVELSCMAVLFDLTPEAGAQSAGTLSFAATSFNSFEADTNSSILVIRVGGAAGTVTVDFATSNGTATAGPDYGATNGTLTFGPGQTNASFPIAVLADTLTEGDETVYLILSNPTGGATLSQGVATLTILDVASPPASIGLSQSYYTVSESVGTAQISVTRGGATNTTVTVHYETQDGSARAGSDYTAQSGTLTFGPGEILHTISIPILADNIPEGNEGFSLILSNPTNGATLGVAYAYILIPNSESFVQFSSANYAVYEFSGFAIITVRRTPTNSPFQVDYATSDGTATAGLDYLEQHGTLYFGDQTNATFTVPLLDDTLAEGAETVNLTLSNPFNVNLGAQKTARLTILNAIAGVEFALAGGEVSENGGSANIVVRRRGDPNVTFAVDYATTTNGTAKAGEDYQPVSGTLTFAPGEKNKVINIPIPDDPRVNGDRTVSLELTNPKSGTVLAEHDTYLLTIQDNEAPAVVDSGFNAGGLAADSVGDPGSVLALAVQSDGKVVIGGIFSAVNGVGRNQVARLNPGGSLDASFDPGAVTDRFVNHLAIQDDGRILIVGDFSFVNGTARRGAARLNTDGSLDNAFNPAVDGFVAQVAVQSDRKILIAGSFGSVKGTSRNRIARLNPDGLLDATFNPGTGVTSGSVSVLAFGTDGKVFIGGDFSAVNGVNRSGIARLNADGSVDATFTPALTIHTLVYALALQADGKPVVSGYAGNQNGPTSYFLSRLNTDGSLDNNFLADSAANLVINAIALVADGKVLVGAYGGFLLLNTDGSRNSNFLPVSDRSNSPGIVTSLAVLGDGTGFIGGYFGSVNGVRASGIARVFLDKSRPAFQFALADYAVGEDAGSVVLSVERLGESSGALTVDYFTLDGSATAGSDYPAQSGTLDFAPLETSKPISIPILDDALVESDESFSITLRNPSGGASIGGLSSAAITIIDNDRPGSLDLRFNPTNLIHSDLGSYFPGYTYSSRLPPTILALPDDRVLFVSPNTGEFFRYNADGSLDPGFAPVTNGMVEAAALQPDGKVLIGGSFNKVLGAGRTNLARLNADGSLDVTFNPRAWTDGDVQAIGLDASGNIVIAELFGPVYNGKARSQIARLKPDGALDDGFTDALSSRISVGSFTAFLVQPDSKVVLVGWFQDSNGNGSGMIRLNSDGSPVSTFVVAVGGQVNAVANQSDGDLVIAGPFTTVQGVRRPGIARLNSDGSVDGSFDPEVPLRLECGRGGCLWRATIETLSCQSDDKVIISGTFTEVQGIPRKGIARLFADGSLDPSFDVGSGLVFANPGYLPEPRHVSVIALQADGKVVIGGQFSSVDGVPRWGLARLHGEEDLTGSFIYFAVANYSFSEESAFAIIRVDRLGNLNSTVSVDFATADGTAGAGTDYWPANDRLTFVPGQTSRYLTVPIIQDGRSQPDGTVRLTLSNPSGGASLGLQTAATLRILDSQRPGSLDLSFDPGEGAAVSTFYVEPRYLPGGAVAVQKDGRIVVGGSFMSWDGASRMGIARLNPDGSLDPDYNPGTNLFNLDLGSYPLVAGLAVEPDDTLLVLVNSPFNGISRLTTAGTVDASFTSICCPGPLLAVQSDGRFLLSNGSSLTRFTVAGMVEADVPLFIPVGFDMASALAVQPDNRIVAAFWSYSSQSSLIGRLHPDGSTDPALQIQISGTVSGLAVQPDGAILAVGTFINWGGFSRNGVARFNTDGSLDSTFDPGTGAPASTSISLPSVSAVAVQPDGKIVLAGEFVSFNGVKRIGIARLNGDGNFIQFDPPTLGAGNQLRLVLNSQPGKTYILQVSADLLHWSPIQTKIAAGFGLDFTETNTAVFDRRFYRIAAP